MGCTKNNYCAHANKTQDLISTRKFAFHNVS